MAGDELKRLLSAEPHHHNQPCDQPDHAEHDQDSRREDRQHRAPGVGLVHPGQGDRADDRQGDRADQRAAQGDQRKDGAPPRGVRQRAEGGLEGIARPAIHDQKQMGQPGEKEDPDQQPERIKDKKAEKVGDDTRGGIEGFGKRSVRHGEARAPEGPFRLLGDPAQQRHKRQHQQEIEQPRGDARDQ